MPIINLSSQEARALCAAAEEQIHRLHDQGRPNGVIERAHYKVCSRKLWRKHAGR